MKLGELVPGGTWAPSSDSIKVLDEHTAVKFQASYYTWATLTKKQQSAVGKLGYDETTFPAGWYKQNNGSPNWEQLMNNEPLPFGSAILAKSEGANTYFTSNGEVVQCDPGDKIQIPLVKGEWKFVANCTPVNRKLGDFTPAGTWAPSSDSVKVLDEHTAVKFQASYYTWATLTKKQQSAVGKLGYDETTFPAGWYKQNNGSPDWEQLMNSEDVLAGQGFIVKSEGASTIIELPAAL